MDFDDLAAVVGILFIGAVLGCALVFGVASARTQSACLRAGYPASDVDWALNRYCIRRVDQTDIVVPFAKAVP